MKNIVRFIPCGLSVILLIVIVLGLIVYSVSWQVYIGGLLLGVLLLAFLMVQMKKIYKYNNVSKDYKVIDNTAVKKQDGKYKDFASVWRDTLSSFDSFYNKLSDEDKLNYEERIVYFLNTQNIIGHEVEISDRVRLLVAASAVTIGFRINNFKYPTFKSITIFPRCYDPKSKESFDRSKKYPKDVEWCAGRGGSKIIEMSLHNLERSFANPRDAYHVGYHEFAHAMLKTLSKEQQETWEEIFRKEFENFSKRLSILRDYSKKSFHEMLAVAVEYYFESAAELKKYEFAIYDLIHEFLTSHDVYHKYYHMFHNNDLLQE